MADYQSVVDELRSYLQSNDQTRTDLLKDLVSAYAEQCRAANQRLRRCEEFLKKGLRSEAIQFAQSEPDLLDVVTALDFPEFAQLESVLQFYGLPAPPRLQLVIAEALNQAYAEKKPLEDLLRQHRRLALARASLPARLEVMRKIAQMDSQNLVWVEDVRAFEEARFRQLQAAVNRAVLRDELGLVMEIGEELSRVEWIHPRPVELCRQVESLLQKFAQRQAREELKTIIGRLNTAMSAGDLPQAQTLRDHFKNVLVRSGLSANDPLVRQADRSLNWVVREEQQQVAELEYQTALADLEFAISNKAEPEEVAQLYNAVLNHGRDLSRQLERRVRAYIGRAEFVRVWRERLILLLVVFVGAAVLLSILGYLWLRGKQHNTTERAERTIQVLTVNGPVLRPPVWNTGDETIGKWTPDEL